MTIAVAIVMAVVSVAIVTAAASVVVIVATVARAVSAHVTMQHKRTRSNNNVYGW